MEENLILIKKKDESINKIKNYLEEPTLKDLILKDEIRNFFKKIIKDAKNGKSFNLLFYGNAGTGKTSSAKMLSVELKKPFVYLNGLFSVKKIQYLLKNCSGSVVCFDEIHNLRENIAEIIYNAIEFKELFVDGVKYYIENSIFVGTTTEPYALPKPLRDRFIGVRFDEPDRDELIKLLKIKGINDLKVINFILKYTQNIRKINKILSLMEVLGEKDENTLKKVFELEKISLEDGFSYEQKRYLSLLEKHKVLSLRALSFMLKKNEDYIKNEIEGDLIAKEIISVTSRGRTLNYSYKAIIKENEDNKINEDNKEGEIKDYENYCKAINKKEKVKEESIESAWKYIKENPKLKEKYKGRLFELVNFIAKQIEKGIEPDLIDLNSFGNDKPIAESYKDNYLNYNL